MNIYLIGLSRGPVKIGLSRDVPKRLCELQIGNPFPLLIHGTQSVPDADAVDIERACHRHFRAHAMSGEWFDVPPADALTAVKMIASGRVAKPFAPRMPDRLPGDGRRVRMRTKDAAEYIGLSASTLEKLRVYGGGPRYAKLGRIVSYDAADLDAWVSGKQRESTSAAT